MFGVWGKRTKKQCPEVNLYGAPPVYQTGGQMLRVKKRSVREDQNPGIIISVVAVTQLESQKETEETLSES